MRIAIVTTSWPAHDGDPSGHFVRTEALELERAGHDVIVVAPANQGAFGWPGVAARVRERPWRAIDAVHWVARATAHARRTGAERVVAHWAVPCAWPIGLAVPRATLEVVSHGGDVRLLAAMPRSSCASGWVQDDAAARAVRMAVRVGSVESDELLATLGPRVQDAVKRIAVVPSRCAGDARRR